MMVKCNVGSGWDPATLMEKLVECELNVGLS